MKPVSYTHLKDDEEIKALFDQWSDDASNEENQYKEFQNLITDALDDMNRDDAVSYTHLGWNRCASGTYRICIRW